MGRSTVKSKFFDSFGKMVASGVRSDPANRIHNVTMIAQREWPTVSRSEREKYVNTALRVAIWVIRESEENE